MINGNTRNSLSIMVCGFDHLRLLMSLVNSWKLLAPRIEIFCFDSCVSFMTTKHFQYFMRLEMQGRSILSISFRFRIDSAKVLDIMSPFQKLCNMHNSISRCICYGSLNVASPFQFQFNSFQILCNALNIYYSRLFLG